MNHRLFIILINNNYHKLLQPDLETQENLEVQSAAEVAELADTESTQEVEVMLVVLLTTEPPWTDIILDISVKRVSDISLCKETDFTSPLLISIDSGLLFLNNPELSTPPIRIEFL